MADYVLLTANARDLTVSVNNYLSKGYKLHGETFKVKDERSYTGINHYGSPESCYDPPVFAQAVIKD